MPRLQTRSEEAKTRQLVRIHAELAGDRLDTQAQDAGAVLDACPGLVLTAHTSLGAVAIEAHRRMGQTAWVWACTGCLGVLQRLPAGTRIYLDESCRRRWRQPEALPPGIVYGRHHTKGLVCGDLVVMSSCNLTRGAGVEHYDLRYSHAQADALRGWLTRMEERT